MTGGLFSPIRTRVSEWDTSSGWSKTPIECRVKKSRRAEPKGKQEDDRCRYPEIPLRTWHVKQFPHWPSFLIVEAIFA